MTYLYNSETENKDTTTVHCSWVKLKGSTSVCFMLILIFVFFNFHSWKKLLLIQVNNIKVRQNELKETNYSNAVQKLQQIIVRLQKI